MENGLAVGSPLAERVRSNCTRGAWKPRGSTRLECGSGSLEMKRSPQMLETASEKASQPWHILSSPRGAAHPLLNEQRGSPWLVSAAPGRRGTWDVVEGYRNILAYNSSSALPGFPLAGGKGTSRSSSQGALWNWREAARKVRSTCAPAHSRSTCAAAHSEIFRAYAQWSVHATDDKKLPLPIRTEDEKLSGIFMILRHDAHSLVRADTHSTPLPLCSGR